MTKGILMLHGFTGGPYEISPLADYIREHTDWIIETPTFCGHGETLSLKGFKAEHWLVDAEIAFRKLAEKTNDITVVGFSMGGVVALYLATRYKVNKLVLLSAAVKYIAPSQLIKDLRVFAKEAINGHLKDNELFKRYESKINNVPVSSAVQFMKIVKMVSPFIESIHVPTYIVQGKNDGIVPYATANYLFEKLPSSEKYIFFSPNGKHHICFSEDYEVWFPEVLNFIKTNT